mmetsp:Transcript_11909/g.24687  ORF Transcript_11909/g.24687 Transcript_11909/m.24687 type:complete len:271 (+) Transcript_11909:861-1673(+)
MEAEKPKDEPQDAVQQRVAAGCTHLLVSHMADVHCRAIGGPKNCTNHGANPINHHALHHREEVATLSCADVAGICSNEVRECQTQHEVAVILERSACLTPARDAHPVELQEACRCIHTFLVLRPVGCLGKEVEEDAEHARNRGGWDVLAKEALLRSAVVCYPKDHKGDEAYNGIVRPVRAEDTQEGVDAQPCNANSTNWDKDSCLRDLLGNEGCDECPEELEDAAIEVGNACSLPCPLRIAGGPEDRPKHSEGLRNRTWRVDPVGLRAGI